MKLNYSLNTGFASGDGTPPTRDNIDSWIAWAPVPSSDLTADTTLGTTFFLTPRAIPQLSEDTVLLGVPVGEAGLDIDASLDPQQLSYTDGADAKVNASRPVSSTRCAWSPRRRVRLVEKHKARLSTSPASANSTSFTSSLNNNRAYNWS